MLTQKYQLSPSWACLSIGLAVIFWALLPGCKSPEMPKIDVKFWAGDSVMNGVTRAQEGVSIPCHDPEFDEMACLSYEDVRKIYDLILQCEHWPKNSDVMRRRDLVRLKKKNLEVFRHVTSTQQSVQY